MNEILFFSDEKTMKEAKSAEGGMNIVIAIYKYFFGERKVEKLNGETE